MAFCCVSTTLTQDPVATWFRLQTTTMPGTGPLSISPCRPPFVCSKIVPQQVQFLTKEVTAGTLVPRLLGQPLHLKLVANSPEPRQGFVFAKKKVLGTQPVWVCTSLPTPRLHSHQGFLCPSAVAVTTVPSRDCHSSQVFSTGPPEQATRPSFTVSIKQFFEVWLLGSFRPSCAALSSLSNAKLNVFSGS